MYIKKRGKKKENESSTGSTSTSTSDPKSNGSTGSSASSKEEKPKTIIPDENDFDHRVGDYQLMEPIGKGGYGVVYRGLHVLTGMTVAVKRVVLAGIPPDELESIEIEIKLLQNLSHPNIVKYRDSIRTQDHLNIILEFVENGSLSGLLTKFGTPFPESLVALYIYQTLKGLHYLHQQGVIHRDVKGANILVTKDAQVKLADFGVATKLNETRKSDSVVGTPYWMAPEIIEMTGQQSSACDIWSVGCTAIELLTGKPPYFDLAQMPALFRIVQDEHPPMPDGIGPAMEDFLMACFAKDPNRRITAAGLLKHPWLKKVVEQDKDSNPDRPAGGLRSSGPKPLPPTRVPPPRPAGSNSLSSSQAANIAAALKKDKDKGGDSSEEDWDAEIEEEENKQNASVPVKIPSKVSLTPSKGSPPTSSKVPSAKERLSKFAEKDDDDVFGDMIDEDGDGPLGKKKGGAKPQSNKPIVGKLPLPSSTKPALTPTSTASTPVSTKLQLPVSTKKTIDAFREADEDELDDVEIDERQLDENKVKAAGGAKLEEDGEADEDDPFNEIGFDEESQQDEEILMTKTFMRLIVSLNPKQDEKTILESCERLGELYTKNPSHLQNLMTQHGVIPIMETLESPNTNVLHSVLRLVNQIVGKNQRFQQSLSLAGLIPAIIRFAGRSFPMDIRMESANFVRQFCYSSDFTRNMFIACDGLPILVSFLQEDYKNYKTLIWNAIDCIRHVFEIKTHPKNDFCRLFCKFGMLEPLAKILTAIHIVDEKKKSTPESIEYAQKIAMIMYSFSQGDKVVKAHFSKPTVIESMLRVLPHLETEVLTLIVKSICNIAMDPTTLDLLEAAGAIPALIPFLQDSQPDIVQHQVLVTMFYLCQIKASRQEQAALSGIIPHLQRIIRLDLPLKQFAYPIVFQLAKTSSKARLELKKNCGVQFYIDTLKDSFWRSHALEVLAAWLHEDTIRVGFILNTPTNIIKLLQVFKSTNDAIQFEKMLPLFRKMLTFSIRVNQSFGRSTEFVNEIKQRLERHSNSNNIRINLLKILALIFVGHNNPQKLLKDHQLMPLLQKLAADKASVIVVSLAQKLIDKYAPTP